MSIKTEAAASRRYGRAPRVLLSGLLVANLALLGCTQDSSGGEAGASPSAEIGQQYECTDAEGYDLVVPFGVTEDEPGTSELLGYEGTEALQEGWRQMEGRVDDAIAESRYPDPEIYQLNADVAYEEISKEQAAQEAKSIAEIGARLLKLAQGDSNGVYSSKDGDGAGKLRLVATNDPCGV